MKGNWTSTILSIYRWTGTMIYPAAGAYVALRASRGKEEHARRSERYGKTNIARPKGPVVWIHAASIGETSAIIPLLERIRTMGIHVILTTGTVTSAKLVAERLQNRVIHQYAPLDLKPAISRFLTHWQPDLAVICESEIWPMTILELSIRRIPQVLVNGRLSDRSFAAWKRCSPLAEALLENLAHVVAQSEIDGERFRLLGARPVTVSGNLKTDALAPFADDHEVAVLYARINGRKTWAAISTHEGEEKIAVEVHAMLKTRHRDLLTIIVPRHPERAEALRTMMINTYGLRIAQKSRNDLITADTDILLGDTIGDMGLYLRLTEIAFVGRSLTSKGGHNPIEPAMLGTVILSGRDVQNFRDFYQRLIKNGGAKLVRDRDMLADAVNFLFNNPVRRYEMIAAAAHTVEGMRGSLDRTLAVLEPFIHPLTVQARLGRRRSTH